MERASINNKELVTLVETGEGKWMTFADAKALKGKRIYWSHIGNQAKVVYETKVGEIISEWDYALTQECEGYANRQEYWADLYKNEPEKIERFKNKLLLLDAEGKYTLIYCRVRTEVSDNLPMVCSDDDRDVYFVIAKSDDKVR